VLAIALWLEVGGWWLVRCPHHIHDTHAPTAALECRYKGYKDYTNSAELWALSEEQQEEGRIARKLKCPAGCDLNKAETLYFNKVTSDVCEDYYARFNPLLTTKALRNFPDFDFDGGGGGGGGGGAPPPLVCYPKLLAGIGFLSEHCDDSSFHGDKVRGEAF
jgi:hypothetical protein